jgi:hypothetical protein
MPTPTAESNPRLMRSKRTQAFTQKVVMAWLNWCSGQLVQQTGMVLISEKFRLIRGHKYFYECPGKHNPDSYDLFSAGPDGRIGTDDDIGNWTK